MSRILVAYASRYGTTAEVAEAIAEELSTADFDVDVTAAGPHIDVSKYDAAVIGSPSYGGKWLADAAVFVVSNHEPLSRLPVAVFTCGTLGVKSPKSAMREHEEIMTTLREIAPSVEPLSAGLFHGSFSRGNLAFCLRILDRIAGTPQGDHRDWDAIHGWGQKVADLFSQRLGRAGGESAEDGPEQRR